jgi:hypothetical protein
MAAKPAIPAVTRGRFRDVRHDKLPRFERRIVTWARKFSCYFEMHPASSEGEKV